MGKAKASPPKDKPEPTPTHGYNLRDRDALKAKKEAVQAANQARNEAAAGVNKGKKRATSNDDGSCKRSKTTTSDPDYAPPVVSICEERPFRDEDSAPAASVQHGYNLRDRKALEEKRRTVNPPASAASSSEEMVYEPQERETGTTFEDLKGMDEIQDQLKRTLIWPFSNVRNAGLLNLDIPTGVLLTGVPGIGKTALADAIVNEIRANGKQVRYLQETGACLSKYVGESEQKLRDLFQNARDNAPSVIFLDEVDGLGRQRSEGPANGAMHTILTTLLTELNTLRAGDVLLLAATNCPGLCDPALLRKGRFDLTINLPLPGPAARENILDYYFGKKAMTLTRPMIMKIVKETEASTGSDLKSLVASVYHNVVDRVFPAGSWRGMSEREIREKRQALQEIDFERDVQLTMRGSMKGNMAPVEE